MQEEYVKTNELQIRYILQEQLVDVGNNVEIGKNILVCAYFFEVFPKPYKKKNEGTENYKSYEKISQNY